MPGFIPFSRASFMLDVVCLAMILVTPLLAWSIYLVRSKRQFKVHSRIQMGLGSALLIAIIGFEVEMKVFGWRQYAESSPYYDSILFPFLAFHVSIASVTTLLWIITIASAWAKFGLQDPGPNSFSSTHKAFAWISAGGMWLTAVTGWVFYYLAFVAA